MQWLLANARSLTVKNMAPSAADNGLVLEIFSANSKGRLRYPTYFPPSSSSPSCLPAGPVLRARCLDMISRLCL